jgi:uncharacterized protein with GYD domain
VAGYEKTIDRYEKTQEALSFTGITFGEVYWAMGEYDVVGILEAPDDETITAALLAVASLGNIRTTTCARSTSVK